MMVVIGSGMYLVRSIAGFLCSDSSVYRPESISTRSEFSMRTGLRFPIPTSFGDASGGLSDYSMFHVS